MYERKYDYGKEKEREPQGIYWTKDQPITPFVWR